MKTEIFKLESGVSSSLSIKVLRVTNLSSFQEFLCSIFHLFITSNLSFFFLSKGWNKLLKKLKAIQKNLKICIPCSEIEKKPVKITIRKYIFKIPSIQEVVLLLCFFICFPWKFGFKNFFPCSNINRISYQAAKFEKVP